MLLSRVKLILDYVKAVEKGEVPVCHDALRLAYSLCRRLPVMKPDRFKTEFYEVWSSQFNWSLVFQIFGIWCSFNFTFVLFLIFEIAMQWCQSHHLSWNDYKRLWRSSAVYISVQLTSWKTRCFSSNAGSLLLISFFLFNSGLRLCSYEGHVMS